MFADLVQGVLQRIKPDATLIICRYHDAAGFTRAKEPQRDIDRLVAFLADDDCSPRGAAQPVVLDIPARAAKHLVASRSQAGEVGDHRASDETNGRGARQAQQVENHSLATHSAPAAAGEEASSPAF